MTNQERPCPACGASGQGNFCQACGSPMAGAPRATCNNCQAQLSAGAGFCHRCGRNLAQGAGAGASRTPWYVAGVVVVVLVVVIALQAGGGVTLTRPDMANAGNATAGAAPAPDISQMSPRERFDRLYTRVMQAGAVGDTSGVLQFTPMALGAYDLLDAVDAQARFRAAMIRLQVADFEGAVALADTILAAVPTHLLGLVILGTAATFQGDRDGLAQAYATFLDHYQDERNSGRPEYAAEDAILTTFQQAALEGAD